VVVTTKVQVDVVFPKKRKEHVLEHLGSAMRAVGKDGVVAHANFEPCSRLLKAVIQPLQLLLRLVHDIERARDVQTQTLWPVQHARVEAPQVHGYVRERLSVERVRKHPSGTGAGHVQRGRGQEARWDAQHLVVVAQYSHDESGPHIVPRVVKVVNPFGVQPRLGSGWVQVISGEDNVSQGIWMWGRASSQQVTQVQACVLVNARGRVSPISHDSKRVRGGHGLLK